MELQDYRVHKSPPLVPILSRMNPIHNLTLQFTLILSSHLRLCLPSVLFPSGLLYKSLYAFIIFHACYMLYTSNLP